MPAGNKDLMYLIANGADGAKEQHGHATGAYAPRTPGKANHDHRGEQSDEEKLYGCLLYTSPSPRDLSTSRMPSSA